VNLSGKLNCFTVALLLVTTFSLEAGDQIQVYTVPKEHSDIPVNAAPVSWTLPEGWKQKEPDGVRIGSFAINGENGGNAEVAITSFPGAVGTELDNVNRWRRELGLEPIGPDGLVSEPVTIDASQGKLFDITGPSARTVVAMVSRNGSSWFIKLRGDTPAVAAAKPVFLEFLKSVRFSGSGGGPTAPDPHAGLALQGASNPREGLTPPSSSGDMPKWNVPSQWTETEPANSMILKSFSVSSDSGAKANVTVSSLMGEGGGLLMNVNRWRGQLGQSPIDADQLPSETSSLPTVAGKATVAEITGTDAKTGQPARMIVAMVPNGDKTWFYKLMGDSKVVEAQKNSFVEFVKTVQYP
jgi:hypothetical protein